MSLAQSGYGMDSMEMANLPSDDAILIEIKDILSKSDLMNVTKKQIKAELEQRYVHSHIITRSTLTRRQIWMRSHAQEAVHWLCCRVLTHQRPAILSLKGCS